MDKKDTQNSTQPASKQEQTEKPADQDYYAKLAAKVRIWKSILGQFARIAELYKSHQAFNLAGLQDKVDAYLVEVQREDGKLLQSSQIVKNVHGELKTFNATIRGKPTFESYCENTVLSPNCLYPQTLAELIQNYDDLLFERSEQKQRIQDIRALIRFESNQLKNELLKKPKHQKYRLSFKKEASDISLYSLCMQRLASLYARILRDQSMIGSIEKNLQTRARELYELSEELFPEQARQTCIKSFRVIYPKLEEKITEEYLLCKQLKARFIDAQKAINAEREAAAKANLERPKTPEEKIQGAFNEASKANKNLILEGNCRSLGFTHALIQQINEDETNKQDIIEYVSELLGTAQGKSLNKSGNGRWKPVQGSKVLYELSINPKGGHRQSMPRLYAKKEFFVQEGDQVRLTNPREKKKMVSIRILLKKGDKGNQENDMDVAEKIFFENDGKQHSGAIVVNNQGWMKAKIANNPTPTHAPVPPKNAKDRNL